MDGRTGQRLRRGLRGFESGHDIAEISSWLGVAAAVLLTIVFVRSRPYQPNGHVRRGHRQPAVPALSLPRRWRAGTRDLTVRHSQPYASAVIASGLMRNRCTDDRSLRQRISDADRHRPRIAVLHCSARLYSAVANRSGRPGAVVDGPRSHVTTRQNDAASPTAPRPDGISAIVKRTPPSTGCDAPASNRRSVATRIASPEGVTAIARVAYRHFRYARRSDLPPRDVAHPAGWACAPFCGGIVYEEMPCQSGGSTTPSSVRGR